MLTETDIQLAKNIMQRGSVSISEFQFVMQQFIPRVMRTIEYAQSQPDRPLRDILPAERPDFIKFVKIISDISDATDRGIAHAYLTSGSKHGWAVHAAKTVYDAQHQTKDINSNYVRVRWYRIRKKIIIEMNRAGLSPSEFERFALAYRNQ